MMNPTAQKVQEILHGLGCECRVLEFTESTRTAQEAAERAGCQLSQIVKSLIFQGAESGKPILVLTSGVNRVDEKKLAQLAGEPVRRPDADFVRAATGYAIGGVPPVGHPGPVETYLDQDLLQYEKVWAAAGTPNAIFEIGSGELLRLTSARVVQVK